MNSNLKEGLVEEIERWRNGKWEWNLEWRREWFQWELPQVEHLRQELLDISPVREVVQKVVEDHGGTSNSSFCLATCSK